LVISAQKHDINFLQSLISSTYSTTAQVIITFVQKLRLLLKL